jgi:hypothetical protein
MENTQIVQHAFDTLTEYIDRVHLSDKEAYSPQDVIELIAKIRMSFMKGISEDIKD